MYDLRPTRCLQFSDSRFQYIRSLRSLCALHHFEFNVFSLFQRFESFSLQSGIMHEDIIPTLQSNEPKPFAIVEPLHRAFCLHRNPPFLNGHV